MTHSVYHSSGHDPYTAGVRHAPGRGGECWDCLSACHCDSLQWLYGADAGPCLYCESEGTEDDQS